MLTVELGRTPEQFWRMTPRETNVLMTEFSRMEKLKGETNASRVAYAYLMMKGGKTPFGESDKPEKIVVDNDRAFAML